MMDLRKMFCDVAFALVRFATVRPRKPFLSACSHWLSGRATPFPRLSIKASVVAVFVCEAAPAPEEEAAGMRSALEYLQKLDKYYSQIARPR